MLRRGLSMFKEPFKALLQQKMLWEPIYAGYKSGEWRIRVNSDFPETSLYTLYKHNDALAIEHFDNWPKNWDKGPDSAMSSSMINHD